MISGIHYFSTELKTKIDVNPRSCFNVAIKKNRKNANILETGGVVKGLITKRLGFIWDHTNAGSMLGQRRRRWANIYPTLVQCILLAAYSSIKRTNYILQRLRGARESEIRLFQPSQSLSGTCLTTDHRVTVRSATRCSVNKLIPTTLLLRSTRQTRDFKQCWAIICNTGPMLRQH